VEVTATEDCSSDATHDLMLVSEQSLGKDWLLPEEDMAWQNLKRIPIGMGPVLQSQDKRGARYVSAIISNRPRCCYCLEELVYR